MKKSLLIILVAAMLITTACGKAQTSDNNVTEDTANTVVTETDDTETTNNDSTATPAQALADDFKTFVSENPDATATEICDKLSQNPSIAFGPASMPIEPGLLSGFDNAEITGFADGCMMAPMIGTIPFVSYVFVLDEATNANEFITTLESNANLRWNICTEAEEMLTETAGNKVFFVMSPKSFDE